MDAAPNPWSTLYGDTNSYITLATALLGVSATFAGGLLSDDTLGRIVVVGGWAALAASILCSIYAKGRIFTGLRLEHATQGVITSGTPNHAADATDLEGDAAERTLGTAANGDAESKKRYRKSLAFLNLSVVFLLLGTVLLAVGAWRTATAADESEHAAELARETVATMTGAIDDILTVERLEKNAPSDFRLVVRRSAAERFDVVVAGDPLEVVAIHHRR